MNKVVLMGNLARDPETRYSQSAEPVAVTRYTIAVSRRFKREGEPDTDFIPCVVFGKAAEFAERYFKKGLKICVSGSIRVSSWDDKQTGQKRFMTEVVVDEQDFAESRASFESRQSQGGGFNQGGGGYNQGGYNNQGGFNQGGYSQGKSEPSYTPDSFAPITQSIDDEDLPF